MKFEKYKFRKYDKKYKKLFQLEKGRLRKIFPNSKIEHIGSTSVEGLGGKGILDINLETKKSSVKSSINKLIKNKYILILKASDRKERWFFEKDYFYKNKIRRVHIHLTIQDSYTWHKCILFRNLLKENKKLCRKYSNIKKEAILKNLTEEDYKKFKNKFIEDVLKK